MATCQKCGRNVVDAAKFCRYCGAGIQASPAPGGAATAALASSGQICSHCGTALKPGARFCKHCGTQALGVSPVAPRQAVAAASERASAASGQPLGARQASGSATDAREDKRAFFTPSGAILALICFFLPWVRLSCVGVERNYSGADEGGILWLVFAAALVILAAFYYFRSMDRLYQAKPFVIIGAAIALLVILIKYISFTQGIDTGYGKINYSDLGLTLQFGGMATIIGYILALAGVAFFGGRNKR